MRSWTGGNDYLIVHVTCSLYVVYENKHVHYQLAFLGSIVNVYLHLDNFLVFINKNFFGFGMFICKKVINENELLHCDLSIKMHWTELVLNELPQRLNLIDGQQLSYKKFN